MKWGIKIAISMKQSEWMDNKYEKNDVQRDDKCELWILKEDKYMYYDFEGR